MNVVLKILYTFFFIVLALMLFKLFLIALLVLVLALWLRTFQMKREPNQQEFSRGRTPNPRPDGFYHGDIGFETSWVGKKFYAESSTGINVFREKKQPAAAKSSSVAKEKYPFKTSVGTGLFDPNLFVLKIDYNVKENPFWVRWVLDEIVEVAPGDYLGKVHLRVIPGFPFSVLYFELKKQ